MSARDTIIVAAERLFAERGIDDASLREITRAAGERNVRALQYHFADRRGLVVAVLEFHAHQLAVQMHDRLDALEHAPDSDARSVVECFVAPLCAIAWTPRGLCFAQIAAEVIGRARHSPSGKDDPLQVLVDDPDGAIQRWAQMIAPFMSPLVSGGPLHQRFALLRFAYVEVARQAQVAHPPRNRALFESHLTDLLTALAEAQPSGGTMAALEDRNRA
ncbi:helix-turn-helix domain-containing protein [Rhodococcus sp. IEGM 1354]|uniref:TetR/AcrR family transcriptional regulator n=1 Tax=Rhodococcus sp. IEGM 1354 TaxID=3047088 RepID=UPI0024B857C0|nr:TetR/AcrR family transcriptional regulator [Rhodococcus sp. IEGM 1354]MDI9933651.1 helix-turn-helix domain-containing protein [Rhodococcus sp. IEGM 1354]